MLELLITRCSDPMMWYSGKVGERVPLQRIEEGAYWSREDAGPINRVEPSDAVVVAESASVPEIEQQALGERNALFGDWEEEDAWKLLRRIEKHLYESNDELAIQVGPRGYVTVELEGEIEALGTTVWAALKQVAGNLQLPPLDS